MISTKHSIGFADTGKKSRQGDPILKPLVVLNYNKSKMGIDVLDQKTSNNSAVRRYHKAADEMLLGTAVVNAWIAYREKAGRN